MARSVSYRIADRPDGLFDAVATLAPDRIYRCEGFASLAAAEAWVEGLRLLMAAIGAPLVRADRGPESMPEDIRRAVAASDAPPGPV